MRPTRDRAGQQKVRDIRTCNDQHETADGEQDLQAGSVLFFYRNAPETDAGARGNDCDRLLGKVANDIGHPVARITGVVLDPLTQDSGQAGSDSGDRGIPPKTANDQQP